PRRAAFATLPVPSTVPAEGTGAVGERFTFGHFSSFAAPTAGLLIEVLPRVLDGLPTGRVLLIGGGADEFARRLVQHHPRLVNRVKSAGLQPLSEIAGYLRRCDVMLQPVGGGVSGRNTSVLASLANGLPVVTTSGLLTESYWAESDAVALAPV